MTSATEREILERELARLSADGYDVFVTPGPSIVPDFLEGYVPDAIAFGKGRKVALEVASANSATTQRLDRIATLFKAHDDWDFRVIWVAPNADVSPLPTQSLNELRSTIAEIERLSRDGLFRPAFLLGWATFEAASRALVSSEFVRPQTPGRLVQVLAREGYLTPEEADSMREFAELRNRLIHGALDAKVGRNAVDGLLKVLQSVTADLAA